MLDLLILLDVMKYSFKLGSVAAGEHGGVESLLLSFLWISAFG